jgi:hypothetical protein
MVWIVKTVKFIKGINKLLSMNIIKKAVHKIGVLPLNMGTSRKERMGK